MPLKVKRHKKRKMIRHRSNVKKSKNVRAIIPKLQSKFLREAWDHNGTVKSNFNNVGLANDPNEAVGGLRLTTKKKSGKRRPTKIHVTEAIAADAKIPRVIKLKLPSGQIAHYKYFIDKYRDNYKEMAKDSKNVYQETWKCIRNKIQKIRKIERYEKLFAINEKRRAAKTA